MTVPAPLRWAWRGYREAWRRYADFRGYSSFGDYGAFFLVNLAVGLLLQAGIHVLDAAFFGMLSLAYAFAALLPGLAVTVRFLRGALRPRDAD